MESSAVLASPPPLSRDHHRLAFHGDGGTLFSITIVNVLLTVVTLGVYYFWAKTRVRGYTHGQFEFDGDRFAYHGTGRELLLGWVKGAIIFGLYFGGLQLVQETAPDAQVFAVASLLLVVSIWIVMPIAMVGSRKYRLSRASWRGIRFSFRGQAQEFLRIFLAGALASVVTLGMYYPFYYNNMWRYLIQHSYFGSSRFEFDGEGRDLFWRYVLAWALTPFTFGLYWFWFVAERQRYYWAHTHFGEARFHSDVRGGPLFRLTLGNVLLVVFTLGLAVPWVVIRNLNFLCRYVSLRGPLDVAAVQQDVQAVSPAGEAVADFLGLDVVGLVPA